MIWWSNWVSLHILFYPCLLNNLKVSSFQNVRTKTTSPPENESQKSHGIIISAADQISTLSESMWKLPFLLNGSIHSSKDFVAISNLTEDLDDQIIDFWTLWKKTRVGRFESVALKHVSYHL